MLSPFGHAAHHAAGAAGGDDRLLELARIPTCYGLSHRLAVFLAAEDAERRGAVVREVGVDIAPTAVLGRIHAHHPIALVPDLGAVHFEIMPAAQRGDRLAQIDRDTLAPAGAQFPEVGGGETGGGECRRTGRTDAGTASATPGRRRR